MLGAEGDHRGVSRGCVDARGVEKRARSRGPRTRRGIIRRRSASARASARSRERLRRARDRAVSEIVPRARAVRAAQTHASATRARRWGRRAVHCSEAQAPRAHILSERLRHPDSTARVSRTTHSPAAMSRAATRPIPLPGMFARTTAGALIDVSIAPGARAELLGIGRAARRCGFAAMGKRSDAQHAGSPGICCHLAPCRRFAERESRFISRRREGAHATKRARVPRAAMSFATPRARRRAVARRRRLVPRLARGRPPPRAPS